MARFSRILLEGAVTTVIPDGDELVAPDGRRVAEASAVYLPPSEPSKILCVHLNHVSRVTEFMAIAARSCVLSAASGSTTRARW